MTEHRYKSPDGNEWVAIETPSAEILASYPDGTIEIPMVEPVSPSLDDVKATLKNLIDAEAETQRLRFITGGAGQALTYAQKADEAKAFLAASDPVDADYPLLVAEIGITAPTILEVATVVHAAYAQWQQIGAAIEAMRLGTKAGIEDAATIDGANAAAAAAYWP